MKEGTEEAGWNAGSEGGAWSRGMGKRARRAEGVSRGGGEEGEN